jgi:hypothetical protein
MDLRVLESEPIEDWFGLVVQDDGWVSGVGGGEDAQPYDFGTDEQFYRDLVAAGFPMMCDSGPLGSGVLMVDFAIKPSLLPVCHVTAYGDGHPTPEIDMGEAGVVVHNWLDAHPDVRQMIVDSVRP